MAFSACTLTAMPLASTNLTPFCSISKVLLTPASTQTNLYTSQLIHKHPCTPSTFCRNLLSHQPAFYTNPFLHKLIFLTNDLSTPTSSYTNEPLHAPAFTQTNCSTNQLLHKRRFASTNICEQAFTQISFYTNQILPKPTVRQTTFYANHLLHQPALHTPCFGLVGQKQEGGGAEACENIKICREGNGPKYVFLAMLGVCAECLGCLRPSLWI